MTEPAALDEILASRTRLVDLRNKTTDTLSLTLRNIGFGLAATVFTLIYASAPHPALIGHKHYIAYASASGAFSIFLDVIQSLLERRAAQSTLDFYTKCAIQSKVPTPLEIKEWREQHGANSAMYILYIRALFCLAGTLFLFFTIAKYLYS